MTCLIVALTITCTGPSIKTSPAEAVKILGPPPIIRSAPVRPPFPIEPVFIPTSDGPFGNFPAPEPLRRLDGSLWTDPQWEAVHYGNWPWFPYRGGRGARSGSERLTPRK